MAQYPCSTDNAPYKGAQQTIYVALVRGSESSRYKLRLCPSHFASAQDHLAEFKVDPTSGTPAWFGTGAKCITCFKPMDEYGWQVFLTVYPANQEREDYWGCLHDQHEVPFYLYLHPDSLEPLRRGPLAGFVQQPLPQVPVSPQAGSQRPKVKP